VRELAHDGSECRVVYSRCAPAELDTVIREERERADAAGYELEWKVYSHDTPPDLGARLMTAGFVPDPKESVLLLVLDDRALAAFDTPEYDIRRVRDGSGLDDVAAISREIGRGDTEQERRRLAAVLHEGPDRLSIHVAYVDDEPVACGRLELPEGSSCAELAGGRTRTTHRHRGLFTALVASRLREAMARHRTHVFVDALPTSEPILLRRGFAVVSRTQPFVYEPGR
jgi:hypothetical protein